MSAFPVLISRVLCLEAGVIPGRGPPPPGRRLSFMVGFWSSITARYRGIDKPGPGQPFPDLTKTAYTWPFEMKPMNSLFPPASTPTGDRAMTEREGDGEALTDRFVSDDTGGHSMYDRPIYVSPIWEPIEDNQNSTAPCSTQNMTPHYYECFQGF